MEDKTQRDLILNQLKHIMLEELKEESARIYLFGSWARNEEKQSSDIDVAVDSLNEIKPLTWVNLLERIEESTIPYRVDVVNMDKANEELIKNIKREGIIWKDFVNA
ncbi:putative nucleotidyltransferase [Bacillus ectoiniformans]|uniref:nucleotidyltransferase family protein n=1 Tax=Bacillus ectoiniformans TaxID=1494429 RepID=UPI00195A3BAC|nr:nucleotidyltransferase domain-containing protein [Bacillus ectoiniformans]MBM7649750.1 putative nucleotidyltransferase [Bacillus ectoiniformans]